MEFNSGFKGLINSSYVFRIALMFYLGFVKLRFIKRFSYLKCLRGQPNAVSRVTCCPRATGCADRPSGNNEHWRNLRRESRRK